MSGWTRQDVAQVLAKQAKPSKYRNQKTVVDGITFDSKKEAQRYHELKLMEKAGCVRQVQRQPRYGLRVNSVLVAEYRPDFEYEEFVQFDSNGAVWRRVVEDVKGIKTAMYRLKKRMFEAQTGRQIRET